MAETALILRKSRDGDAPALAEVFLDTFQSTWRPAITPEAARAYLEGPKPHDDVAARGAEFTVAELSGELVGLVDWEGDFVNALHVRASAARRGVGSRLMDAAEAAIAAQGHAVARLETDTFNTRARSFYAARGYAEAGRYPDEEWNSGLTTLLMVKTLT